jgi:hypothetical protein
MAGKFFGFLTLAVVGVIVADVLIHPRGVQAAGGVANSGLRSTYAALLGNDPRGRAPR